MTSTLPRPGIKPSAPMTADKPLPQNVERDPEATGVRIVTHPKDGSSSTEDDSDSSGPDATNVAGEMSRTSSVNTEKPDTSLTSWRGRNDAAGSSNDVR